MIESAFPSKNRNQTSTLEDCSYDSRIETIKSLLKIQHKVFDVNETLKRIYVFAPTINYITERREWVQKNAVCVVLQYLESFIMSWTLATGYFSACAWRKHIFLFLK